MDRVHLAISEFLQRHAVRRSNALLLAVSGGGDSVAMLHALSALGQRVAAAHVHHGLRGASAELDLELVRERSAKLGVRFLEARVDVRIPDGRSPEARARVLRYAALERLRADHGFAFIATGHTLDDQAETLLLRAIRGTSPGGLSGIAARAETEAGAPVLRPLLSLPRCLNLLPRLSPQRRLSLPWRRLSPQRRLSLPRHLKLRPATVRRPVVRIPRAPLIPLPER